MVIHRSLPLPKNLRQKAKINHKCDSNEPLKIESEHNQWWNQHCPDGGINPKEGVQTYYFGQFFQKMHEFEQIGLRPKGDVIPHDQNTQNAMTFYTDASVNFENDFICKVLNKS